MQMPIAKTTPGENNDLARPLLLNISQDADGWKDLIEPATAAANNFRLEFESSPFRTKVGRAQKAFTKLGAKELMDKIQCSGRWCRPQRPARIARLQM